MNGTQCRKAKANNIDLGEKLQKISCRDVEYLIAGQLKSEYKVLKLKIVYHFNYFMVKTATNFYLLLLKFGKDR